MKKYGMVILFAVALIQASSGNGWSQELLLTSPIAGETWNLGQQRVITWHAGGTAGDLMILVLPVGSNNIYKIAEGIPASQQSYTWRVGTLVAGALAPNTQYTIRLYKDPQHFADASGPITIGPTLGIQAADEHPRVNLRPGQPQLKVGAPPLPDFDIARVPKIEVTDMNYDYQQKTLMARVRNTGNAAFVGRYAWTWNTDCGGRSGVQDIPPNYSAILESPTGMALHFTPCLPPPSFCSFRASVNITPQGQDGRLYPDATLQKDFYQFENSQFPQTDSKIRLIFLRGSAWVNCSHEYIITGNDIFEYDPQTKKATFMVVFPLRNCGGHPGTANHYGIYQWSVRHSPSNQLISQQNPTISPRTDTGNYDPGQVTYAERALTLKVQSGLYMLNTPHCVISIRFADNLIH